LHNSSFSIEEFEELHPLDELKDTDARLRRHKLHRYYLLNYPPFRQEKSLHGVPFNASRMKPTAHRMFSMEFLEISEAFILAPPADQSATGPK